MTGSTDDWVAPFAARLAALDGAVAVALGGSRARGTHRPSSDVDVALFYRGTIAREDVLAVVQGLHDEGVDLTVTEPGEWGPWVDGGAWFRVGGTKADLLYREVDAVRRVMDDAGAGRFTSHYQPGHPAGYHSFHLMAEVAVSLPLTDQHGELAALKARTATYPPALRSAVVRRFGWEAEFQLAIVERTEIGEDPFYEQAALSRVLASLVQVLYAVNRRWFVNEKRALAEVATMPAVPDRVAERFAEVASLGPGAVAAARRLHHDTMALAEAIP